MALSVSANQVFKQINIPLLLSLGIHGVFFAFILPKWSGNGNLGNNSNLQSTPVIELNQLEQTRIPQQAPVNNFNWNLVNGLEENNEQTLGFNLPNLPLPTPPNNPLSIPPINNADTINLPSLPPLPPPPASFYNSSSQIPLPNYQAPSTLSLPPNLREGVNEEMINNLPAIVDSGLPQSNQQITTRIQIDPEEEAKIRERIFANSPIQVTANPRDVINGRNISENPSQNNLVDKEAIVKPLPKNYQSLASKLEKKTENTSDEDARKNYVAWATEVESVQSQKITLQGIYPKDACIRKLEGTTTYGIIVNQSGKVINTKLIKSSGYNLFNNQALTQIKNRQFANQSSTNQPYHVYVNFKFDSKICPSLSINDLGKIPPQKAPVKSANQNNTKIKPAIPAQSPVKLPNSPENTAEVLIIPTPTQNISSPNPVIKSTPSSISNQLQPVNPNATNDLKPLSSKESEKESFNSTAVESNPQSTIKNSEKIKLVE